MKFEYENTMNTNTNTRDVYVCVLRYANNGGWQWRRWEKRDNANNRQSRRLRIAHPHPPDSQSICTQQHSHKYHIINLFSNWIYIHFIWRGERWISKEPHYLFLVYNSGSKWNCCVRALECYTFYSISVIARCRDATILFSDLLI